MIRRLAAAVAACVMTLTLAGSTAHAATREIPVFGDSIALGRWIDPTQSSGNAPASDKAWPALLAAATGATITNYAVGGMALHEPTTTKKVLLDRVREVFAQRKADGRPVPETVIVAIGTNDMMSHDLGRAPWDGSNLFYSEYAATQVRAFLKSQGVKRVIWNTVYPYAESAPKAGYEGYVLAPWVGPLMNRLTSFNNWLTAMYGSDVVNTEWVLVDWGCWCKGDPEWFADGFHPNAAGHARIAWAMQKAAGL